MLARATPRLAFLAHQEHEAGVKEVECGNLLSVSLKPQMRCAAARARGRHVVDDGVRDRRYVTPIGDHGGRLVGEAKDAPAISEFLPPLPQTADVTGLVFADGAGQKTPLKPVRFY